MVRQFAFGLLATAVLAVASGAVAQDVDQAGAGRRQRARVVRLSAAEVPMPLLDSVVTLTTEQKEKLTPIYAKYAADVKALAPAGRRQAGAPVDPGVRQKRTELQRETGKQIEGILTPDQLKKLRTASPQIAAARSAGLPLTVLADLKLTDDQRKQIADIVKGVAEQLKGLSADERRAKSRDLQRDARTKVEALLTADQKDVIAKFQKGRKRGGAAGAARP